MHIGIIQLKLVTVFSLQSPSIDVSSDPGQK